MAAGIIKNTQSEQVALMIEKEIANGNYPLGRKMPSTRMLAQHFDVGHQVVKSAFQVLDKRGLIIKKPRVGIFVNPANVVKQREYFLFFHREPENLDIPSYASKILSIENDHIWQGINQNTRRINTLTPNVLSYEVDKIASIQPDCLITGIYTKESIELFSQLTFPVIVLGDNPEVSDIQVPLPDNQIIERTEERSEFAVQTAAASGCKNIGFIAGGHPETSWGQRLVCGGQAAAEKFGSNFVYVHHKRGEHDATLDELMKNGRLDAVIIDGFRNIASFIDKLKERGYKSGHNIKIFADGEMCPGTNYIHADYCQFSKAVLQHANSLVDDPTLKLGKIELSGLIQRQVIPLGPIEN